MHVTFHTSIILAPPALRRIEVGAYEFTSVVHNTPFPSPSAVAACRVQAYNAAASLTKRTCFFPQWPSHKGKVAKNKLTDSWSNSHTQNRTGPIDEATFYSFCFCYGGKIPFLSSWTMRQHSLLCGSHLPWFHSIWWWPCCKKWSRLYCFVKSQNIAKCNHVNEPVITDLSARKEQKLKNEIAAF